MYLFSLSSLSSVSTDSHTLFISLPPPLSIVHLSQIGGFARFVAVEIGVLVVLEIMVAMVETMKRFAWLILWVCGSYSGF